MSSPYQPLFLHFVNRELMLVRQKNWSQVELGKFIRLSAILTAGKLTAPFGQAHELLHPHPSLMKLVANLVSIDRLDLTGGSSDVWSFLEHRKEIYGENKQAYSNYFNSKFNRLMSDLYAQSKLLRTTPHIKGELAALATGTSRSNLFSSEEQDFAKVQRDFLTRTLIDKKIAATFSIYLKQEISPQPEVSHRLGTISSRIFSDHYQDIHATVSPTGLYQDPLTESYDQFPLYDIQLNFFLLSSLGLDSIIVREDYANFFFTFARSENLYRYIEMKDHLFLSILEKLKVIDGIHSPNSDNIKSELRKFSFAVDSGGFVPEPTLFAEGIRNAMVGRTSNDFEYRKSIEEGIASKLDRVSIAIFTATNLEDNVLRAQLTQFGFLPAGRLRSGDGYYNLYSLYDRLHVVHVRSGMGTSGVHGSQRIAQDFLAGVDVEMVISVGICFGIDSAKQALCDVVVAEQFTMYEPAKVKDGAMEFRGDRVPAETRLVSYGRTCTPDSRGHATHVGPVLTGDKLVDDAMFRTTILAANGKAVGGEMEAGGILTACAAKQVRFAMVKGICDFAEKKADDVQELAATNAIRLVLGFIQETWGAR